MNNSNFFPLERNRYFYGKMLTARDFETEQRYFNNKRRLLNRTLYGAGVVCGLGVYRNDDVSFSVETGMALDYMGREICVSAPVIRKLRMVEGCESLEKSDRAYLCLQYAQENREPVNNIGAADSLLRGALEFDLIDDRTAACGLTCENAVVNAAEGQVYFNMLLDPDRTAGANFRTKRLGGMLRMMFRTDRYFPDEIAEYIEKMCSGGFRSCTAAYAAWREIQPSAQNTREAYLKESLMKYLGRRLRGSIKKRRRRRGA